MGYYYNSIRYFYLNFLTEVWNFSTLTYCMVQSPSWEANWFAASQEIPRISRNPKVHYRTHKRPPPVSIKGQPNPVHIPTSHLLEIHPNIIHPSMPRSPQWSPSLRFPQQNFLHTIFESVVSTHVNNSKSYLLKSDFWYKSPMLNQINILSI